MLVILLSHMQVKPPIPWGKIPHKHWLQLDDTGHSKLTNTGTLSERLNHLEWTIFAEAATLFGHSPPPKQNLAGQSHRTKLSINLIKEKNLWLAQIKSSFLPQQRIALDHLLLHVRSKIRSLHKAEKSRKRRCLLKKAHKDFKCYPYKASKSLLDPKYFVSLKVDQANLDQHNASTIN